MDYAAVRTAIGRLRAGREWIKVFGANGHGFILNTPLTEVDVRAFEERQAVALPADYRGFLIEVGNGGAGPYYGLFKLGEMDDNDGSAPWLEGFVGSLAAPFPFTEAWNDLTSRPYPDRISNEQYERDLDAFEKQYWKPIDGAFPICHLGCAMRVWLVISGPERGHVWLDDRASDNGISPVAGKNGERLTYGAWYQVWLDEALAQLGQRLAKGEPARPST